MDITNSNFITILPEIRDTIIGCDFMAFDTELSGLMKDRVLDRLDSHESRFAKAVNNSRGYLILQFGLSCFTRIDHLHYSNKTYNFYIFPQAHEELGDIDRTFSIQAHAVQFLIGHGFDFNKLFKHGINYLSFQEKKLMTGKLKARNRYNLHKNKPTDLAKQRDAIANAKGFLEVVEWMVTSRKPIVGHNLILDLVQLINQFMEPLTDDYNSFKQTCNSLFPLIYDTKFMAHAILDPDSLTNNQSRLNDLYSFLREGKGVPQIKMDHLQETIDENQLPHQAGYDAFMSGYSFIVMCEAHIRDKRKRLKLNKEEGDTEPVPLAQNDHIVGEFANRIHFSYSSTHKCFHLDGDDDDQ